MSQADVQTMRAAYEAFNRGDIPAVLEAFDPEVEWREPGGGKAPEGTFHGAESVANDVFGAIPANFDEFRVDTEHWLDARDHLVVTGHFRGRAKSGERLDAPCVHLWTMRDGKAASFENLIDQDQWTRAWGG